MRQRWLAFAAVAAVLCGFNTLPAQATTHDQAASLPKHGCFSVLVPSYFYPATGAPGWETVVEDRPAAGCGERVLLVNPSSGPGKAMNPRFREAVRQAQRNGVKVYGYIATGYGKNPLSSMQQQARLYATWYGVNGVFLDEVSYKTSEIAPYYQPLITFITTLIPGGNIVLNPGTYPEPAYAQIKVPANSNLQIVIFEHDYAAFTSTSFQEGAWTHRYPSSMFINIVYKVPEDSVCNVLRLSAARNVGWVYVTDLDLPNPYKALPSYWTTLNRDAQAGCRQ